MFPFQAVGATSPRAITQKLQAFWALKFSCLLSKSEISSDMSSTLIDRVKALTNQHADFCLVTTLGKELLQPGKCT